MIESIRLIPPHIIPPLDDEFRPAVLANRAYEEGGAQDKVPLVFGLERGEGQLTRFESRVFPESHPRSPENYFYAERILKFLLWQRGGYKIFVGGSRSIGEYLQRCYSPDGTRNFDYHFMSEQVYGHPLTLELCDPVEVPPAHDTGRALGRHLEGCRVGFDLGASDRKVSAVIDGKVVYSEEVAWEPRNHADPEYHYGEIIQGIKAAASKMPRVDAIGGSSAGIYIDNQPMVASIFRSIPQARFAEVRNLFHRIQDEMSVPLEIINDGDVTALAGSMSLNDNAVLGIAMGSSQAAGFIDTQGNIMGWLNELSFAPIDYNPAAPVDEWSGDIGCGSSYFSQLCIFRLAAKAGIDIPVNLPDVEKLNYMQEKLKTGHEGARKIWQTMGIYLGYALAHYSKFYGMKHVIILGRCTSGAGGTIMLEHAQQVLEVEFPELAGQFMVQLPDEHSRRVGQAIAAASLPVINGGMMKQRSSNEKPVA